MPDLEHHLLTRRTVPSAHLTTPGPDAQALNYILTAAARTPDHGKLVPYRFVVLEGMAGDRLGALALARHEEVAQGQGRALSDQEKTKTSGLFSAAPMVITLVDTSAPHAKIPEWEQRFTVGAVGMNLIHAAAAKGFIAQWLTGWAASDPAIQSALGLTDGERIAGFFHIGTAGAEPVERARPDIAAITTHWSGE